MHRTTTFRAALGAALALTAVSASAMPQTWPTPFPDDSRVTVQMDEHGQEARALVDSAAVEPGQRPSRFLGPGWSALGPFGGDVDDVAASPTAAGVVLAGIAPSGGSGGTLYRSTDSGASWTEVAAVSGTSVHDIEFDASGKAYLGTLNGVWTSTDDGATWTQQSLGIGVNDQTFEVTIDPNNSSVIWAGVADALGSQTNNVLVSTNGGVTWSNKTPPGAAGTSCQGIGIDPTDSTKIFAAFGGAFGGGSVYVSSNSGTTWTNRSAGLPANPMNDVVHDGSRALLCGGQLFGSQNVGLYETIDDGVTWTALHDGSWPNLVIHDIEIDPANSSVIYVASAGSGVYRSTDGGANWTFGLSGTGSFSVNEVSVDPAGGTPIYAGSSSVAVWKSTDGTNFLPSSAGIGSLNTESVAANPLDSDELAVAFQGLNDGGVYTSTDGGLTWAIAALPGTRFNTVKFAPDGTLYAISDGPTTIGAEGLYRRSGAVWTSIGPDQGSVFESELFGLDFSTINSNLIVTSGADFGVAGFEPTVWVSSDGGSNWSKNYEGATDFEDVTDVIILADGTDQLMVASYTDFSSNQDGGALRSTDGGATWADSSTGLAAGAQCFGLSPGPTSPTTIYLADDDVPNGAVYRSTDAGASWTATAGISARVRDVATDPSRPNRVWAACSSGAKVRFSDDVGASYIDFDVGLAGSGFVKDLKHVPSAENRLLLATSNGVYASTCGPIAAYGSGCAGSGGFTPSLSVSGCPTPGGTITVDIAGGLGGAPVLLFVSTSSTSVPLGGGCTLLVFPWIEIHSFTLLGAGNGNGVFSVTAPIATSVPAIPAFLQGVVLDPGGFKGYSMTNGISM